MSLFLWFKLQLLNLGTTRFCLKVIAQIVSLKCSSPQDIFYLSRKVVLLTFNLIVETPNIDHDARLGACVLMVQLILLDWKTSFLNLLEQTTTPNRIHDQIVPLTLVSSRDLSSWSVRRGGDSWESPEPDVADEASRAACRDASYASRAGLWPGGDLGKARTLWGGVDHLRNGITREEDSLSTGSSIVRCT